MQQNEHLLAPLTFTPAYQNIVWGGRRMEQWRNDLPEGPIGESWDISDQERGMSIVAEGPLAGESLASLSEKYPQAFIGANYSGKGFPLLIKVIDANDRLSVQVHPDDALAQSLGVGERGKTECWLMIGDGGELFQGTKLGVSRDDFEKALADGTVDEQINRFETKDGDFFFMPARTVHALGRGCLLYEVQQSCDCTFRVFDWGRVGLDGKPRETHVEQSLETIDFSASNNGPVAAEWQTCADGGEKRALADCEFFTVEEWRGDTLTQASNDWCTCVTCLSGEGELKTAAGSVPLKAMTTVIIPAAAGAWSVDGTDARLLLAQPR